MYSSLYKRIPPSTSIPIIPKLPSRYARDNDRHTRPPNPRKTITMPQLLDLPNELLRTIADELTYLPRDYPYRRFQHPITAFRLTNRRLAEVGKFVFRNFSAVRECPPVWDGPYTFSYTYRPFYNFTVRKYLRLLPQQPEFVRLIENVHLSESAYTMPYLMPDFFLGGYCQMFDCYLELPFEIRPYTLAYETVIKQFQEDMEFLDEITKDLPQNHCLKYDVRIEVPPVIREREGYPHDVCQDAVEWRLRNAEKFLEEPTSGLWLRQLPWLRSLTIAGLHIQPLMRAGPVAWEAMNMPLWPSPKLRNLVAGGFYSPGIRRREYSGIKYPGEGEPWWYWTAEQMESRAWKGQTRCLDTLEFIDCRIDGAWLTSFLPHAAASGLRSFRYSHENYCSKAKPLDVFEALKSSPETHKLLEDLRLDSSHGYQIRPADAIKIRDSIGEFPALRKFTTDYRVLLPGSDGPLGEEAWKDVFKGELRHIETPRSKTHRKKAYDDRMPRRWKEMVDCFHA
ncbi:hypothetical protein BZA05DRAFT_385325 [Tricharina praecox]|uniref:uncharacterized protein n=1 Tax=Tricharina praecox TaxID=43433 RepID=UPI0022207018|nr:uncharacterized protein BZA05DRAFT_385325 [Tricharina praecox]KAI5857939.1 hypothetical protein BZA05DRAFT_385325 [Tricharina praecox]